MGKLEVSIRQMTKSDIPRVLKLEKELFADPWPRRAFEEQIEDEGWGSIVAESSGVIIGYGCYLVTGAEAHLTNIAVEKAHRRKSVANQLLQTILDTVIEAGCEYILLEVRPSNKEAIRFYEKNGFDLMYRRPAYYRRPAEDALVMVRYVKSVQS
jgi:ribosomal-protein-alanine N-acetyltransferase